MKSSVLLLLLLLTAFTCGDDNTAEELQVETLVRDTHRHTHCSCNTTTHTAESMYRSLKLSPILWSKGETRNLLCTFHNGRHAADPLHGKTRITLFHRFTVTLLHYYTAQPNGVCLCKDRWMWGSLLMTITVVVNVAPSARAMWTKCVSSSTHWVGIIHRSVVT